MSGQDPRRRSSRLVNDRRFSIDEDIAEEEINPEEINPKRLSSSSQRRVGSKTDANKDSENDVDFEDFALHYEDSDDDTGAISEEGDDAYFFDEAPPPLCGWCCFRPGFLQCCRTVHWALLALCIAGIIQGMVIHGFYTIDITTIERRFGLRSRFTGFIAGVYDLAAIFAIFPLTLRGGLPSSSKPRWFGCGMLLMGIGSLIFTVPHFIAPVYEVSGNTSSLCFDEHEQADEIVYEDLSYLGWLFLLGQILHGLGTSPLYTLGVIYIDENVPTLNSTLYIGIFYSMNVVGTAIGYVIGGLFLRIFTNLSVNPDEFGLTLESSSWIGAWWIGYLLSAALCFVVGVWLLAFPPYLPTTQALREENKRFSEVRSVDDYEDEDEYGDEDKEKDASKAQRATLTKSLLIMCNNRTLLFINLAVGSGNMVNSGFIAFLPKIMENQFSINPSHASLILGLVTIPLGGGATFLGGYLVRRFQLLCPGILKFCIITTFFSLLFTSAFLFTCPNQNFAGVTSDFEDTDSTNLTLNQTCNEMCDCSPNLYEPICGIDETIYYSPCYAGCVTELSCGKEKYFSDCKCIGGMQEECTEEPECDPEDDSKKEKRKAKDVPDHEAVSGKCDPDCGNFVPFTILIVLLLFCTFLRAIPSLAACLRCVHEHEKAAALGSQWFCIRVLGSIPSPIIFGHIIDMTCLLWRDQTGSCLVFDNMGLSFYLMLLTIAGKTLSMFFYFIAWMCFVPTAKQDEDEDQETLLSERSEINKYGT